MSCEIKYLCLVLVASFGLTLVNGEPKVPCYFIFGDSLLDNGNNNLLDTKSKVQFLPYGIDFPEGPTGRFANGRNIADFIAEYLGFEDYIPPFASAKDNDILRGLNYASGSAGILEESGQHVGERISLDRQLINHMITVKKISMLLGINKAKEHLSKCIYTVGMGTNDYINNYFLESTYTTSQIYTPDQYAQFLIQKYSRQLTKLYLNGARKVGVSALGDLGCLPFFLELYGANGTECVSRMTSAVQLFNDRLVNLIQYLNNKLEGAHFIYVPQNSTSHPLSAGVKVTDKPCCVVSRLVYKGHCIQGSIPCPIRDEYAYYDEFHPTEFVMNIRASMAFTSYSPFYKISSDLLKPNYETNVLVSSK